MTAELEALLADLSEEDVEQFAAQLGPLRLPRTYVPVEPNAKQEWFLRRDEFEVFFGGAAGPGKLLNCSTVVPTPGGWTTIGELQVGDTVFGEDGKPYEVEWLSDIDLRPESYRLTFDDGSEIEACADHLWLTYDAKELSRLTRSDPGWRARRAAKRPSRAVAVSKKPWVSAAVLERNLTANPAKTLPAPTGTVRTTKEIAATLLTASGRRNHAIPVAAPLDLPDAHLPLDPYVLGVWLGDGNTDTGMVTSADPEVLAELAAAGWGSVRVPSSKYGYRVTGLTVKLREIGLIDNKHVPAPYLRGSIEQRLALLQGLMDTDGTADQDGRVVFTSTLEHLAASVHELACSLGQKATVIEGRAKLNGADCGPVWDVAWTPTLPVFRLSRKLARIRAVVRRTCRFRYITGCDPIPSVPMRCIRVSNPTRLFLVGRTMIPTHNSWALLMAALQYVDVPGYNALLLRPMLGEFEQAGGLIPLAHEWLDNTDARWNGSRREWRFPSTATVRFGYLSARRDVAQYKGPSYSFCGFDELTSFPEWAYRAMFRVLRQAKGVLDQVPLRMRSASNPGDLGHAWVKTRFVEPESREKGAVFIPATIDDNPHLDYKTYVQTLSHLSPVDRERLIRGDWDVSEEGGKFKRENFKVIDASEAPQAVKQVRYWDLAGTVPAPSNPDPDWTVGLLLSQDADDGFTVRDIVRGRWEDAEVQAMVRSTAEVDGHGVAIYVEQDPGQAGKSQLAHYQRRVLAGYACHAGLTKVDGKSASKEVRARPVAAAVANGLVRVVRGENIREFIDECAIFQNGTHDDCVDAFSGAHRYVTGAAGGNARSYVARGRVPTRTVTGARQPGR